ncbi:MAG: hypothetical protein WBL85_10095 [Sedimentisphaerales bacterium]
MGKEMSGVQDSQADRGKTQGRIRFEIMIRNSTLPYYKKTHPMLSFWES